MDIGKSIAVFVLAIIGLQLAECGWMLITQKFSETWILKGLVVAGVGSFFVVKFWRHDDSLRRWTLSFCKAAYFLFPTIILLGLILGHPMSITLPFLHTRTDSPIIVAGLGVGALAYVVLVHVLLSSRRAIAEFVDKNALPAGQ